MTGRRSKWWRSDGWRMAATAQSLSHCFHQLSSSLSLSEVCLGSSRFFPPTHTTGTQCMGAQLRIELFQMKILTTSRIANRSSSLHGQVELIKVCSAKWFKVPNITFTPTTWKSKVFISSGSTHKDTKGSYEKVTKLWTFSILPFTPLPPNLYRQWTLLGSLFSSPSITYSHCSL